MAWERERERRVAAVPDTSISILLPISRPSQRFDCEDSFTQQIHYSLLVSPIHYLSSIRSILAGAVVAANNRPTTEPPQSISKSFPLLQAHLQTESRFLSSSSDPPWFLLLTLIPFSAHGAAQFGFHQRLSSI